jgi:acyl-coenzyme A thioesterase PaaI-like protein
VDNLEIESMLNAEKSALADMGMALRALQNAATGTSASLVVAAQVAAAIDDVTEMLRPFDASVESLGADLDTYVRARAAHTLQPIFLELDRGIDSVAFSIRFGMFHRNPFGQVHGGAIAMMFDSAIARLGLDGEKRFLTANLSVDYRSAAPIDVEFIVNIRVSSSDGRKRFIEGELLNGDTLIAEVHALFIEARK